MRLLADIKLFVTIVELKNFGRAAEALGLTPSTVSRRVSGLEKELGVMLVRRSTRSFALTQAGQQLFERSRSLMQDALRMQEELSSSFTTIAGHVRVGAPSDLIITILAPVLAKYCEENVGISLDVVSAQGQPRLEHDRLDVAFAVTHHTLLPDSSFSVHPIGSFGRMLYASKTYLERYGMPRTPQELKEHRCVRYLGTSAATTWILHRNKKAKTVPINGPFTSGSIIVLAHAARAHLGIAMLPSFLATHPMYGAGLVRVLPDWEGTPVNVLALTAERKLPGRLEELIRVTRSEFKSCLAVLESA